MVKPCMLHDLALNGDCSLHDLAAARACPRNRGTSQMSAEARNFAIAGWAPNLIPPLSIVRFPTGRPFAYAPLPNRGASW